MKLKKIASLMLAGVMAVSMLAGCKDGGNSNSGSSSENTNTNTGYSAILEEKAADALYKAERDKVFTFADNADDQKALAAASLNLDDTLIETWVKANVLAKSVNEITMLSDFSDKAKLDRQAKDGLLNGDKTFVSNLQPANTVKVGEVWAVNGTTNLDVALEKIFDTYKSAFEKAPKSGTLNASNGQTTEYNYSYTVSVSVVNVPARSNLEFSGSVNLVAVTVTRTGTAA